MRLIGRTPTNDVCLFNMHNNEVYYDHIWMLSEKFGWFYKNSVRISEW